MPADRCAPRCDAAKELAAQEPARLRVLQGETLTLR
jgi:hypothetical protein